MTTITQIRDRQRKRAGQNGITCTVNDRTHQRDDNLFIPLTKDAQDDFDQGRGNELDDKISALHSSAALVYNVFEHWRDIPKDSLVNALSSECCLLPKNVVDLKLERKFPTVLNGTPPHLDVAMTANKGWVIAIESKFTEHYSKRPSKLPFAASYFPKGATPGLWERLGLIRCQNLAAKLQGNPKLFMYLDAAQLLKHFLGLQTQHRNNFILIYLYYDWPDSPEAKRHKTDIDAFATEISGEVPFCAMSYNELYSAMMKIPGIDAKYLKYLFDRYFDIP